MCCDSQAALEKSLGFLTHIQSGVSLIWGVGQLESEMTLSPAQAVIDNEILAYVRRFQRGVDVTEETLAVDVTRDVGISGDYLSEEHTRRHFRTEFFEPSILLRETRSAWESRGSKSLHEVAEAKADEIIARPLPETLAHDKTAALREMEGSFLKMIAR
jgi:trimethylamine--corrinoid protein Co-methyltransferase